MEITVFVNQFISGCTWAAVLFLISSGLVLIFSVLKVVNFAHGVLYMLGAYICYAVWHRLGEAGLSFWIGIIIAGLAVGAVGLVIELLLRPLYKRELSDQLLLTFGLVMVISDLVKMSWGREVYSLSRPAALAGALDWDGVIIPVYNLFLIALVLAVAAAMWLLLSRTRLGFSIRAAAFDRRMASMLGIRIPRLFAVVFGLGSLLAGITGAVHTPLTLISLGMDAIVIMAFAVVVIGGMGSLVGAALASLVLGIVYSYSVMLIPQFSTVVIFVIVCLLVITRPEGLLREAR